MDTCVGAPGSVQFEVTAASDFSYRAVDFALDGACVFLNLPAAVAGSGILDSQLEAGHSGRHCTARHGRCTAAEEDEATRLCDAGGRGAGSTVFRIRLLGARA